MQSGNTARHKFHQLHHTALAEGWDDYENQVAHTVELRKTLLKVLYVKMHKICKLLHVFL